MYYYNIAIEEINYLEQYNKAISKLMDGVNEKEYIYPLINLIHQLIELDIKSYIAESMYNQKTYQKLRIDNCHDLKRLIENEQLKKYYNNISEFEDFFKKFSETVLYFSQVLGNQTFLNSRYYLKKDINEVTLKKNVDISEFSNKWIQYREMSNTMGLMYIAFINAMIVLYLDRNNLKEEIDEFIQKIINSFKEDANMEEDSLKRIIYYMKKYITRNEYYGDYYAKNKISYI